MQVICSALNEIKELRSPCKFKVQYERYTVREGWHVEKAVVDLEGLETIFADHVSIENREVLEVL